MKRVEITSFGCQNYFFKEKNLCIFSDLDFILI